MDTPHVITQEDMDANPILGMIGATVGESISTHPVVEIEAEAAAAEEEAAQDSGATSTAATD